MRYCTYCGMPMEDDDLFCTRCGKPAGEAQEADPGELREETVMLYSGADSAENAVYDEYEEEDDGSAFYNPQTGNRNRIILIACAVIVVAVFGILVAMLIRPGTDGENASSQEQVAVYEEEENGAGGHNMSQGSVQPASGENHDSGQKEDSGNQNGSGDKVYAEEKGGSADNSRGAGTGSENGAGQDETQTGQDKTQTGQDGGGEQAPTGWIIDEDGNEVYYPAEGEEYRDNDQTEVGGDYAGGSGASNAQSDSGQGMQTRSADEFLQEDDGQGQDAPEENEAAGMDSSYILPESASRNYSRGELEGLDNWTLQMAINEIYARHGRKFDTPEVRAYFESKSWYRGTIDPDAFDGNESSYFNQYEMSNRELMAKIRAERDAAAGAAAGSGR